MSTEQIHKCNTCTLQIKRQYPLTFVDITGKHNITAHFCSYQCGAKWLDDNKPKPKDYKSQWEDDKD